MFILFRSKCSICKCSLKTTNPVELKNGFICNDCYKLGRRSDDLDFVPKDGYPGEFVTINNLKKTTVKDFMLRIQKQ